MDIQRAKELLVFYELDYLLLTDYHGRDQLSVQLADLPKGFFTSRRWIYIIPREGRPIKIVSYIEKAVLDVLEGETYLYTSYESLKTLLVKILKGKKVAMQYAPSGMLPVISTTDAGFVELVREIGGSVYSSGDLLQHLYAVISPEGLKSHQRAGKKVLAIRDEVYAAIRRGVDTKRYLREVDVLKLILRKFEEYGLTAEHDLPYVAVNDHAVHLTFEPNEENSYSIKEGDRLLLDLWAKENDENAIYYDVSFCAYVGKDVPIDYEEQFQKVVGARECALQFIEEKLQKEGKVYGYEVDRVCRSYLVALGEGDYFLHRTGHNIGKEVHGPGANLDAFESIDHRRLIGGTMFSIEPGLYKGEIGVRTEVDVYLDDEGRMHLFGEKQNHIFTI